MLFPVIADAQSFVISGKVRNDKGKPVKGASVSIDNTIDGATTDSTGSFEFTTEEKGMQLLVITEAGHEDLKTTITISGDLRKLELVMRKTNRLSEVVISAGAFEASNDRNKSVLSTLDIVTTAGANADVAKAIQTLPGTQQQGTQTGLFVRGGDASEAAVVVDGLVAQNAFFSGAPGVATRSRFSPFQFKGVSFSSGGYSARYGQALSSVLELNTLDMPDKTTVNVGFNMAGLYASGAKLWKKSALELSLSYNNLAPFYKLATTNVTYNKVPEGVNASGKYSWKPNKDGLVKLLVNASYFTSTTTVQDPDSVSSPLLFGLKSQTYYGTLSYRQLLRSKWTMYTALAYSHNQDKIDFNTSFSDFHFTNTDQRLQYRLETRYDWSARVGITAGTELQHFSFEKLIDSSGTQWKPAFAENAGALYAELEWKPSKLVAIRPGVRAEHSQLLAQTAIGPRLSMAVRAGTYGQFGLAGGVFYQNPDNLYLLSGYRPQMQYAVHSILNYQWSKQDRTLRMEIYYKDYQKLVRETMNAFNPSQYRNYVTGPVDNSGHGYAKGFELFWRDRKSVKNLDYWLSYSYIDTRRLYANYAAEATPTFISNHNLNLIGKYYIEKLQTQINATYSYASGRPYYNAANPEFLGDRTPDYHNLSMTVNYLTHIKKWFTVVYAGVDNMTNQHNIFGYRYSTDGKTRTEIKPALYRSFFVGVNFSLTEFNKDEL
ncbi:TonB-dependent receptor [Rurimicrobium arvi]|uniref:TonB-dependent receptor n=1 Tax=Rurimicrobium arvi TaxID=2049916 RepID=A0ABP8MT74_9BACT